MAPPLVILRGRDGRAGRGARVQADVIRRRIGALHLDRACLVDRRSQYALAAEIQRRGAVDTAEEKVIVSWTGKVAVVVEA